MVESTSPITPSRIGRHDIIGYIAAGGMAELFLGRDPTTRKPVVIKRMFPHLARQTSFVSMFIDEARLGTMIHHPNLVEHLELGQVGTELFLVMEYLEGENLIGMIRRLVKRGERLDYGLAAYITAQACLGLHAAHLLTDDHDKPLHIVHRDVSPSNIFVTYEGDVKVLDFGIATAAQRLTQQTATGQLKGKFSYMSPEQCRGESLDARSDIFSLGVVLYELTLQKRLFKRDNELLMLNAVCEDPIPRPSREDSQYPTQLEDICLRALSRDRRKRYQSAKAMHADLVSAMTVLGVSSDPREVLAQEMRRLFPDRIAEKSALVKQVRAGSELGRLPTSDVDVNIDVPDVTQAPTSDVRTPASRRFDRKWAVVLALAVAVSGVGVWYVASDRGAATVPTSQTASRAGGPSAEVVSPPVATAAPAPAAPASAGALAATPAVDPATAPSEQPPAPVPGVEIAVVSRPPGKVFVDGKPAGQSPVTIRLTGEQARIEVRRAGYVTVTQEVSLDRDQRLLVTLERQKRATTPRKSPPQADDFPRFDEAH